MPCSEAVIAAKRRPLAHHPMPPPDQLPDPGRRSCLLNGLTTLAGSTGLISTGLASAGLVGTGLVGTGLFAPMRPAVAQTRIDFTQTGGPELAPHGSSSPFSALRDPSSGFATGHAPSHGAGTAPDLQEAIDQWALGRMPQAGRAAQAPSVTDFWSAPRELWLRRRATGQSIKTVWWSDGQVRPQAYIDLSLFLRDPRMEARIRQASQRGQSIPAHWHQAVWINPVVLNTLYALGAWLAYFGMARPIEVTRAFSHPLTNAAIEGAARDSLHQIGAAVDVIVPGVPASKVAEFGAWMRGGGVGVYLQRDFTHLDAGRVRSWRGN
jgi:uncharacterized protein YcbK (DUF882 family)